MQKRVYIIVSLLSLAGIFLLFSTISLFIDKKELSINIENEEKAKKKIESELVKIIKEKEEAEKKLREAIQAKMDTQLELSEVKSKIEVLELKVDFESKGEQRLTAELEKKKEEVANLSAELKKREQKESSLSKLVDRIKQEKEDLLAKLKGLKEGKEKKGEVVLDKIVVKAKEFPEGISGEVLAVNKKYNFLILNVGKNEGVKVGAILTIHHGSKIQGKARIKETYNDTSEAIILEGKGIAQGNEIRILQK